MLRVAAQNILRRPLRAGLLGLSVTLAVGVGFAGFVGGWALAQLWMFWIAPILGAAIAGVAYGIFASAEEPAAVHTAAAR